MFKAENMWNPYWIQKSSDLVNRLQQKYSFDYYFKHLTAYLVEAPICKKWLYHQSAHIIIVIIVCHTAQTIQL